MAVLTKIRGSQIKDLTVKNLQIAADAAIETTKLAQGAEFIQRDGSVKMTGSLDLNAHQIVGLAPGTQSTHAVNVAQLQAAVSTSASGLDVKESVLVATTPAYGDIADFALAPFQIDNVTLAVGDRVLVKDQTDPAENGIYGVTAVVPGVSCSLARTADADNMKVDPLDPTGPEIPAVELSGGTYAFVEAGDTNADSGWIIVTNGPITTLGTDPINWTQFTGLGQVTDGNALIKTGNRLDVVAGIAISVASDKVDVLFDDSNFEIISGNKLSIKNGGVDAATLNADVAGNGLSLNATTNALEVNVSDGLTIVADALTLDLADGTLTLDATGLRLTSLPEAKILIGSATGVATAQTLGGDVKTIAADGTLRITDEFLKTSKYVFTETPSGLIDNVNVDYDLNNKIVGNVGSGNNTLRVFLNGLRLQEGVNEDYTVTIDNGAGKTRVTFTDAPKSGDVIIVEYMIL